MNSFLLRAILLACCLGLGTSHAASKKPRRGKAAAAAPAPAASAPDGEAERRLIDVYKLIGRAETRKALAQAQSLVADYPNFQLAQLVYGDLLMAQSRPVRAVGDVPDAAAREGMHALTDLREEAGLRLRALREVPPAGTIPVQFAKISPRIRHAIAVDTARARLYLFENSASGMRLIANYYVSIGKSGIDKAAEGDMRTPLGMYFVTSNLARKSLKEFYGAGALPINYPNPYDLRRGKTGGGIWLHGTPPSQFARSPKTTDGCIVLSNPDLMRIIRLVEVRSTPVLIARNLQWVAPQNAGADTQSFADTLEAWRAAKSSGDVARIMAFYAADFAVKGKTLADWAQMQRREATERKGAAVQLKDISYFHWADTADTMVATFGEVVDNARKGATRRQYWMRQGTQWKIFHEGPG